MTNQSDSELNYLIAPEIKEDEFYSAIQRLARRRDISTVLEIGSSSGGGSTEAFVTGLRENPNRPTMFCMEVSKPRFAALEERYAAEGFVRCYNVSSVSVEQFPNEEQVTAFYQRYTTPLNHYPLEQVIGWLRQDITYVNESGVVENGIQCIKTENQIDCFDLVLIDGSEFTGSVELDQVYGAKFILLDDICTYKNFESHQRLLADPDYALIEQNTTLRNGYSIFRKLEAWERQPSTDLPVHFFTIVLNGQPFIQYHIDVFEQLPFDWHWHIVEGVAELKHDTAWSIEHGGQVTDGIHRRGLSLDGTTEYLDQLQQRYPDRVTVYRKPAGAFWHGKREMVNAPLADIRGNVLLWQLDVDELWTVEQICRARVLFLEHPEKTAAFYWCWYFVGETLVVSSRHCYSQNPRQEWLRTWRFSPGAIWATHEPPTLVRPLPDGKTEDIATINPFLHQETEKQGLLFQHFSYVTPEQLTFKEQYYGYRDAVAVWQKLQTQTTFPLFLRDYFAWVTDDTLVEPASVCGVVPIAYRDPDTAHWRFLQSEDLQQKMMNVKKPFPQVVVDGVFFQFANSGIAQVWRSLLEQWSQNGFAQHVIVLDRDGTAPRIPGIRYRPTKRFDYDDAANDAMLLQNICDEKGADLFISSYYTTPLTTPSVFMAYDMIPEVIGANLNETGWREKHYGIMHASRYITISESTARDLVKFFPHIPEQAVTVAHCGVKEVFSPASAAEIERFQAQYQITKPYFLLVGDRVGVNGYKNAIFFFKALSRMADEKDFMVVCVGGRPELEPEFAALTDVPTTVLKLDDAELRAAFSGALALVYPSQYEGFGLPIAEAMACGCPVITCRKASIPEVAGDAAIYVDETSLESMVQALETVRQPEVRQHLVKKGFEQIQRFSWAKMAEIVADVLLKTADQLQQNQTVQTVPIWTEFRKLQLQLKSLAASRTASEQLQATQAELASVREQLKAATNLEQLQSTQAELASVREKLKAARQQLKTTRGRLDQTNERLQEAEGKIEAMLTSKFWKLRSGWFRLKKALRLSIDP